MAVSDRIAGKERRRRRHHRGLAGQVRDRGRVTAARRRQQRAGAAGDRRHLQRAWRESLRRPRDALRPVPAGTARPMTSRTSHVSGAPLAVLYWFVAWLLPAAVFAQGKT